MKYDSERTIDDVVDVVRRARANDGAVVLLGAGCSKTAGIPLASDFQAIIESRFPRDFDRAHRQREIGYQQLMAEISGGERRDLLAEYIDNARLNWAHIALAELIKEGYVTRVLTPNFDSLVVQACALLNVFPAIYDLAASQIFKPDLVPTPAVFYLHGQRSGFRLLSTDRECREHTDQLRPVFQDAGARRPWIVLGYSGINDPVFEHLLAGRNFDYRLYWVTYRSQEPPRHLADHLLREGSQAFYVPGFDADSFLAQLADRLGCFPPDLVRRPFTHLNDTLNLIGTYEHRDTEGKTVDLLAQARRIVEEAVDKLEQVRPESAETSQGDLLTEVRARFISGDYASAINLASKVAEPSEDLQVLLSWSYNNWGVGISEQAEQEEWGTAQRLFRLAAEKFAAGIKITPEDSDLLTNWGNSLFNYAKKAAGNTGESEAARLLEQAERLLLEAAQIDPGQTYNLACLRAFQGRPEESRDLLLASKQAGRLPSRDHLLKDSDLASVRQTSWFQELLSAHK